MSNFDPNAILRGAQLTVVGAHRALQNPSLFKYEHFRQAAIAVCAGIAIRMIVALPIILIKFLIWVVSWFSDLEYTTWDDQVIHGLDFISTFVLQVPFLLMTLTRYITPTLDDMFMESLKWVDSTYIQKHKSESPENLRAMYHCNLVLYQKKGSMKIGDIGQGLLVFLKRYGRRTAMSLAVYLLSMLPLIGRFVLPAASFYTFNNAVGLLPAMAIFGSGIFLPKYLLVVFLQSYFSSRSLMRELLEPYFSRIQFSKEQKRRWFLDREGVLFGFAFGFYFILRTPLLGVLLYGVAEASTAYLLTKITDPPPPPAYSEGFAESQVTWKNKHAFLKLPMTSLDLHNVDSANADVNVEEKKELPQKKFS